MDIEFKCKKVSFDGTTVELEDVDFKSIIGQLIEVADYETVMTEVEATETHFDALVDWIDDDLEAVLEVLSDERKGELFNYFGYVKKD